MLIDKLKYWKLITFDIRISILQYAETTLEKSCIYNVQLMYSSLLFLCMNGVVSPIKKRNYKANTCNSNS